MPFPLYSWGLNPKFILGRNNQMKLILQAFQEMSLNYQKGKIFRLILQKSSKNFILKVFSKTALSISFTELLFANYLPRNSIVLALFCGRLFFYKKLQKIPENHLFTVSEQVFSSKPSEFADQDLNRKLLYVKTTQWKIVLHFIVIYRKIFGQVRKKSLSRNHFDTLFARSCANDKPFPRLSFTTSPAAERWCLCL